MNRIRNRKSSHSNPLSMFSAGVEQIIRDHQASQTIDEDQEARVMERAAVKQTCAKNLYVTLLYKLC
jgi:hypothetical protein